MSVLLRSMRLVALALTAVLALAACGGDSDEPVAGATAPAEVPAADDSSDGTTDGAQGGATASAELAAEDLKWTLNTLLQEHVFFAGAAVNEALQGNTAGFEAAAAALDENSVALSGAVGLVYGDSAGEAFLGLWRSHIGMFVDYTTGLATGDQAQAGQAVEDLVGYANDFAVFLNGANPNLPVEVVEQLVLEHVLTTKGAVDALADGDAEAGFAALREAMGHMSGIADPLSGAIAAQFPDRFPGDTESAAAGLKRDLNLLLQEHTYLAGAAVNEALKGNTAAFEAAAGALDGNSQDLAGAVGSVYGEGAGDAFLGLWRSHIGMFVDYTTGVATNDQAMTDKAVADLTQYANDFAVFLNGANDLLPVDVVEDLVVQHVLTLKDAVDAIASGQGNPFIELREAGAHMHQIANPLADAIAQQQGL
jgi:hypothetical protein